MNYFRHSIYSETEGLIKPFLGPNCKIPFKKISGIIQFGSIKLGLAPVSVFRCSLNLVAFHDKTGILAQTVRGPICM